MSEHESHSDAPPSPSSKRKRSPDLEISIDLSLPEPASKKARRSAKKASLQKQSEEKREPDVKPLGSTTTAAPASPPAAAAKRSDFGIWVGNLPFTATKESLREFLRREGAIQEDEVVRVHLPTTATPARAANSKDGDDSPRKKNQNKGFAYIDFTTADVLERALGLSERLVAGRRVLIKNAKSFEGRPVKEIKTDDRREGGPKKQPSKRIFVGNLGFDVTKDELAAHFARAGPLDDLFLATFEDSGKCKGFAWVTFANLESAEAAVKGFVLEDVEDEEGYSDADQELVAGSGKKKTQRKKHFINRLSGRQLRCEYAEDAQTRYKKRFGKDRPKVRHENGTGDHSNDVVGAVGIPDEHHSVQETKRDRGQRGNVEQRREDRRKRHEKLNAQTNKPAVVHQRVSGAIVAGAGKKMTFDE